jgi:hydrogenase maturation protease
MKLEQKPKLVVIGLGQELRGDDAVGIEVVRRWELEYPETANLPDLQVEIAGLAGLDLLNLMEGMQAAILVDAVQSGAAPGSLHELGPEELASFEAGAGSAHDWGVAETLAMAEALGNALPGRLLLLAVEAGDMSLGAGLSPAVQGVLPQAVERLQEQVISILFP